MNAHDAGELRAALGVFATGVTVVTTASEDGEPIGVTASSFNSVSLDPPLVLWSLAKKSRSLEAFRQSGHFAVHILSCLQEELSDAFARTGADKFDGVAWERGALGSPVFDEFAAKFECRTAHQYEGGDHIIFVGEVIAFDTKDHAPLLFHGGRYADTRPRGDGDETPDPVRAIALAALAETQAFEQALLDDFTTEQIAEARSVLRRIAELAASGADDTAD